MVAKFCLKRSPTIRKQRRRRHSGGGRHFQFISSALGEQSPAAILVETPAATIHAGRSAFAFQHTSADGLDVSLLEALAADALPLIVGNDAGSAAISERGERVTVSGRRCARAGTGRHPS